MRVLGLLLIAQSLWLPWAARADSGSSRRYTRAEFVGARSVDESELRRALQLPVTADSLKRALRRLGEVYYAHGLLEATLLPEQAADGVLRVRIDEGEPTRIAHVFVRGTETLREAEARNVMALRRGQVFRPSDVEERLRVLVEEYARRGHLYATAVIERLEMGEQGVVLGIAISEGPSAVIREIRVEGNSHSRTELVQRTAGLVKAGRVDVRHIRESTQLLRRSGLFAAVDEPVIYRVGGGGENVGVLLRVVEAQRRNTVFGSVGVARDPRTDQPYVSGAVDLQLRNIYGTGRDLDLAWRRDALAGSNLALAYRERFLFGSPFDFKLNLLQTVRDSTYTFQSVGGALVVPLARNWSLEGGAAFDRSVFHVGVQGNSRRFRGRIGLAFESLAQERDGRHFGRIEVFAEYAHKANALVVGEETDASRIDQTLWTGNVVGGVMLRPRHVVAARGSWRVIMSDEPQIAESELFYFGGARTLRGYREDQFRGDQVVYGGVEYRYGDPRRAQLYGFVDVGALRRKQERAVVEAAYLGYGFGLRGQVATGTFDLAFGIGEERSIADTKLHVALMQRF
ncbi:MAG: BamA/TamA family outer membrane protein [Candidatus Latescibacterota bacterium]|nr:MAG: BamA/TamA family outer membrane protein [Candidatus Latescibacterota bacterium]